MNNIPSSYLTWNTQSIEVNFDCDNFCMEIYFFPIQENYKKLTMSQFHPVLKGCSNLGSVFQVRYFYGILKVFVK